MTLGYHMVWVSLGESNYNNAIPTIPRGTLTRAADPAAEGAFIEWQWCRPCSYSAPLAPRLAMTSRKAASEEQYGTAQMLRMESDGPNPTGGPLYLNSCTVAHGRLSMLMLQGCGSSGGPGLDALSCPGCGGQQHLGEQEGMAAN